MVCCDFVGWVVSSFFGFSLDFAVLDVIMWFSYFDFVLVCARFAVLSDFWVFG